MNAWRTIRTKFQPGVFLPVLGVCVVLNFAYHFVQGDGGIRALLDYQNRIEKTQLQLDQIRAERQQLEHRVYLLRSDSLDPDMLEERARAVLNFAAPNEFAIVIE